MEETDLNRFMTVNNTKDLQFFDRANIFLEAPTEEEKKEMMSIGIQPSGRFSKRSVSVGQTALSPRSNTAREQTIVKTQTSPKSQFDHIGKPWQMKRERRLHEGKQYEIKHYIAALHSVESEASTQDIYVQYCQNKYRAFMYNIKQFMDDELIAQAKFVELFPVTYGQFKGNLYWGHMLENKSAKGYLFMPHGFGILVNEDAKTVQMGTFKLGKEIGQQRMIQCYPIKDRSMIQFTSAMGKLHGPALIERANGRIEIGEYREDQQHGVWKYRNIDGQTENRTFDMGKTMKKGKGQ